MNEETLFIEALEVRDSAERAEFLGKACAGDEALRGRLERLLEQHEQAGSFLNRPAAGIEVNENIPARRGDGTSILVPSESAGTVIGCYKLLQQIGEGGMGTVYMA